MDILYSDAVDQLRMLSTRQLSARELLDMVVARTDRLSERVNAVVARDLDRAYHDAQLIDDRRARSEPMGRLAGIPMTVKDTFDIDGLPASAGLRILLNRKAKDAIVVSRARAEDAIIWGQTNTPTKAADWQTYNALYGTTNNPWNLERTPGGSSGGSAAALAAGLTALEIGADAGGSLRVPANFCGVFAHKPTYGLISQRGLVPPPNFAADVDLAVVGPMARSSRDLRLLMSVISDLPLSAEAPPVPIKGLKVALWLDEPAFVLDADVRHRITVFAETLAANGAIVEPVRSPIEADTLMFTYTMLLYPLSNAGMPAQERTLYELLRGPAKIALALGAKPLSWAQGVLASTARHREWLRANEMRAGMQHTLQRFFTHYDVLLSPISPMPAFPHDHRPFLRRRLRGSDGRTFSYLELLNWIALATTCGLPATALPIGLTSQNLPVGAQLIGPRNSDARTLAIAQAMEEMIGGFQIPPLP
ncbi:amidase family protein [Beijerinckia indica]|uniref:Amidase n=1 Tax=Beijerinckia indica subsp. indica (strain ATCC 9039 / DSM 1715 / NCIMB 8712) TaxID=395963 RepID=B2IJS1_BEII9|nr:amidase family protein [Beijerinckia indica]ACB94943.1 Amidase [Beijerinckia indica subsp. indica ATCC 9039]